MVIKKDSSKNRINNNIIKKMNSTYLSHHQMVQNNILEACVFYHKVRMFISPEKKLVNMKGSPGSPETLRRLGHALLAFNKGTSMLLS